MEYNMIYDRPADRWSDALPLGNGRLGAMVYGQTAVERIQLNEDSLWYGRAMNRNNPRLRGALPEIRRRVFAGEIREAEDMIQRYVLGAPYSMRHYESLGELDIGVNRLSPFSAGWSPNSEGAEQYHACLDLMRGVYTLTWREEGVDFRREIFVSHPDQALCIRYRASAPFSLQARFDRARIFEGMVPDPRRPGKMIRAGGWGSMFLDENHTLGENTLILSGNAGGTRFGTAIVMTHDGVAEDAYTQLSVSGAREVCLYLSAATDNRADNPKGEVLEKARAAAEAGFDALLARHIADFEPMMRRCALELGGEADARPLPARLAALRNGERDPGLAALYFEYGRYLMLSGGRGDSAALNLQGIWCKEFAPMWDSKYTTNINLQMNYWAAEVCNLSQCHDSLFDQIQDGVFVADFIERGGKPGAERPGRRDRRASDQLGIRVENVLHGSAADDDVFHGFSLERELCSGNGSVCGNVCCGVIGDLERYALGAVDEHAVASGRNEERDALRRTAELHAGIFVPDVERAAVSDDASGSFSQTIDIFAFA